jgi:hypothetical protein
MSNPCEFRAARRSADWRPHDPRAAAMRDRTYDVAISGADAATQAAGRNTCSLTDQVHRGLIKFDHMGSTDRTPMQYWRRRLVPQRLPHSVLRERQNGSAAVAGLRRVWDSFSRTRCRAWRKGPTGPRSNRPSVHLSGSVALRGKRGHRCNRSWIYQDVAVPRRRSAPTGGFRCGCRPRPAGARAGFGLPAMRRNERPHPVEQLRSC